MLSVITINYLQKVKGLIFSGEIVHKVLKVRKFTSTTQKLNFTQKNNVLT